MIFRKKIILFIFSLFYINKSLKPPERIHISFIKHETYHIKPIFENIYKFADSKSKTLNYNSNEMMNTYKLMYKDACIYLLKNKNNSIYLGWTPLNNQTLLAKYYKNITKKLDFDSNVKNIPLYYIICESISSNNTFEIKKIINNPIIDLNIDLLLLKDDLYDLTEKHNTTLNLSNLKNYDNGRWFFIWNSLIKTN